MFHKATFNFFSSNKQFYSPCIIEIKKTPHTFSTSANKLLRNFSSLARKPGKHFEALTHVGVLVFIILVSMIGFVPFLSGALKSAGKVATGREVGASLEAAGVTEAVHVNPPLGKRPKPHLLQVAPSSSHSLNLGQCLAEVQTLRHGNTGGGATMALL